MSVSGIQAAAEINLDEFERRLRSPGSQQASAEDLLRELVRLVDSSGPLGKRSPSLSQAVSMLGQTDAEPPQPLEMATRQPLVDMAPDQRTETASEVPLASKFGNAYLPTGWTLNVSALALAVGAVLIGAAFWFKGGAPGQPKAPPFVAAADGSTNAPQRNGETVATLRAAGAIPLKDITQPASVKEVPSEQHPIELGDLAALGNVPPPANLAPTSAGAGQPTAGLSSGPSVAVAVNAPVVAAPFAAPPPGAPQFPDPKTLQTVSLRPDGTQIATATPSARDSGEAVHANDGPQGPAETDPKGASEAAGVAQPSTHKVDLPTKLSRKPTARIVVAKAETAAPGPEAEMAPEAPAEPQAAPEPPPAPSEQPANPLAHAFSYIVGALGVRAASAPQPAVKGVTSEEQPIELGDHASPGDSPPSANLAPKSAGAAQPTARASTGPTVATAVNKPVVDAPFAAASPAAPQFPNPRAKPSAPIVVAKTETAAPRPKPQAAPERPHSQSQQPVAPLSHASSYIVGALRVPAGSAPQPVDRTAAYKSGDWGIQLGAQKSEAQAKAKAARLNTKYAATLNGATIGVNKTLVNGETIYALRVAGLSKADASALCVRLTGHDCLTAK